jgi:translation initiation factor 1 (eIF-1/SUI1)
MKSTGQLYSLAIELMYTGKHLVLLVTSKETGNELADTLAKRAATNGTITESYT